MTSIEDWTDVEDMKKKELVKIEWVDGSPWPWFYLLEFRGEWVHLQGADYPDGSAKHDGDCFWVHKSEIETMTTHETH